ncbi:unnamed protein product [Camellia sinensis]
MSDRCSRTVYGVMSDRCRRQFTGSCRTDVANCGGAPRGRLRECAMRWLEHDTVYNPPSNSNRCEDRNLFEVETKGLIKLTGVEDTV